jgi:hypothetical protein
VGRSTPGDAACGKGQSGLCRQGARAAQPIGDRRELPGQASKQEKTMSMHPAITAALADQHRRDLIAQAGADRPARAARQGALRRPASPVLTARRVITTAAAACAATALLVLAPAAPGHPSAHRFGAPTVVSHSHTPAHRS